MRGHGPWSSPGPLDSASGPGPQGVPCFSVLPAAVDVSLLLVDRRAQDHSPGDHCFSQLGWFLRA